MKKRLISLMATVLTLLSASGQVTFNNVPQQYSYIEVTPPKNTGLEKIFVLYNTQGVSMSYASVSGEPAQWSSYDSRGGAGIEPIDGIIHEGPISTLPVLLTNKGYVITEGTDTHCYWVVNYADFFMSLNALLIDYDSPCGKLNLIVDGSASPIEYLDINGHPRVLSRDIKLSYRTLTWDDDETFPKWDELAIDTTFVNLNEQITIVSPLCDTEFKIWGDRFLKEWHRDTTVSSEPYKTTAVECRSRAVQYKDSIDNVKKNQGTGLGGSAPCHIVFTGYPTDAARNYRVWEMARDEEFEDVFQTFNQDEVDYTFTEWGTYYMRYSVANDYGTCGIYYGDTYRITVSESKLDCPNAFSPHNHDDVNDIWKVSYQSLIDFHCWIFNRWGTQVYEYSDPSGGWDGTYRGKLVDPGVYYYVITAEGSDGMKYRKRGSITILRYSGTGSAVPTGETGTVE